MGDSTETVDFRLGEISLIERALLAHDLTVRSSDTSIAELIIPTDGGYRKLPAKLLADVARCCALARAVGAAEARNVALLGSDPVQISEHGFSMAYDEWRALNRLVSGGEN